MLSPQLSIIIPCFNIEIHLSKCIESVLKQSFTDFELLLLDDGSTDGTLAVCESFKAIDDRIKVFSHDNRGVSYTRNRGIDLALGDYMMFIDGDDKIKPDYLDRFYHEKGDKKWVLCGFTNVNLSQKSENTYYGQLLKLFPNQILQQKDFLKILEYYSLSSPCARIYEKEVIRANGLSFREELSYQEDLVFNLDYLNYVEQVVLLDYYGYYYIHHQNSSTNKWHKNFEQLQFLFLNLSRLVVSVDDKLIVQNFLLNTILRKIANIYHPNSPKKYSAKSTELREMFETEYFKYGWDYYPQSFLNFILKLLFKIKSPLLFHLYYNLNRMKYAN
jgi:glycosyltransferase involved in cell wall biosynthesis